MMNQSLPVLIKGPLEKPAVKALDDLKTQLQEQGWTLRVIDTLDQGEEGVGILIIEGAPDPSLKPEGLAIQSLPMEGKKRALEVRGGCPVGLSYGIYELSDRIRCQGPGALEAEIHLREEPEHSLRGVDRYLMNHLDEAWFYSPQFWETFLSRLARNRFNRFTLITGFDTSYMTPPYPFFVEVPGFEGVRVQNLSLEKRDQNLQTLNHIARACHERGIEFSLGTWQQRPWTGNQEDPVEGIPEGDEGFRAYCAGGLRELLSQCPGIDVIQFRVNFEAGVQKAHQERGNTHEEYWLALIDGVAQGARERGRKVKLDLRAKGLTDGMVDHALALGLELCIPTKYWCEHAALPYHIPKLRSEEMRSLHDENSSRRYSYGNLLKRPLRYQMIYRLWNYGSTNLFLWGDWDYGRRFSQSLRLGGTRGFEINSPLSLKGGMEAHVKEPWGIHKDEALRTYTWEDDRYWAYYLSFGRWGYDSSAGADLMEREFRHRYGARGRALMGAYGLASRIMPLVTTIHFPVHPSLHYWPELYPGASLFGKNNLDYLFEEINYAQSLPSDEEFFYSIAAYAQDELEGKLKPRYSPLVMREQLYQLAQDLRSILKEAGLSEASKGEELALWVDFTMLALLGEFHAWKGLSAYHLYRWEKTASKDDLAASYGPMAEARQNWADLSALGSRYYHGDLQFNAGTGMARNKNWAYRLEKEVDPDLADLRALLEKEGLPIEAKTMDYPRTAQAKTGALRLEGDFPSVWDKKEDLAIRALWNDPVPPREISLNYRHTDHTAGEYIRVPLVKKGAAYEGAIPGDYFFQGFDVIVYLSALDEEGRAHLYPGIDHQVYPGPYWLIQGAS
ncbi:MAG: hypothetical protein FWH12_09840 [Treponema sp.]|nr:hypothetical protein [Treponema sp.]